MVSAESASNTEKMRTSARDIRRARAFFEWFIGRDRRRMLRKQIEQGEDPLALPCHDRDRVGMAVHRDGGRIVAFGNYFSSNGDRLGYVVGLGTVKRPENTWLTEKDFNYNYTVLMEPDEAEPLLVEVFTEDD